MAKTHEVAIVVGAGPSGLAVGACLNRLSIPNIILEREDCFASLWRKKAYDRLHLHLAKQFCQLPHMPFPRTTPTFASRKDFLHYLDEYVSHFNINPLYHRAVESATYDSTASKWDVRVKNVSTNETEEYSGRFLIVATGETSDAYTPDVQGMSSFPGYIIHSTQYKNGDKFTNKSVLVVGSGNSGMEIALDLANYGANTSIVVRSPIHVLSRWMANVGLVLFQILPPNFVDSTLVLLSNLRFGDLTKFGITRPQEGPITTKVKYGRYPIIDAGTFKKIKSHEIQVLPAITSMTGNHVLFVNGKSHPFDAIIFATGFKRSTNKWLKGDDSLLNEDGFTKPGIPNHWKGKNGLYCAGLARRGLFGSAMDAQNIADDIRTLLTKVA